MELDLELKRKIGWYLIAVLGVLVGLFTVWFATLGINPAFIAAVDAILIETMGIIYYIIKKSFGIPTNGNGE